MRILHVVPQLGFGGAERLATDIVLEINRRAQHQAALLSFLPHPKNIDQFPGFLELRKQGALIFQPYYGSGSKKERLKAFMHTIRNFAPDVLHTHLFEADLLLREEILPGVRYFSHFHDNMWQMHRKGRGDWHQKMRWITLYERQKALRFYRKSHNRFFAISRDTLEYFSSHLPPDLHRFTLLPNAIQTQRYAFPERDRGIPAFFRFCTIGSLVDKKNQIFLIEVAHHLRQMNLTFQLDVLGMGINYHTIVSRIQELGLQHHVIMHGNVGDVPSFLKRSFLYLHAATYEPFGLVLLEAMASGLPVVCLDGKGNRDIMRNGMNGTMLDHPNPEAFAHAIMRYIEQPAEYAQQSQYAVDFAQEYDLAHYCHKLIEGYSA
jgi:glycosyltransferase involved in cell wall biosynthesis